MILIYGASDDLIEIEGDISEEYNCYSGVKNVIIPDVMLFDIEYNDDAWKITNINVLDDSLSYSLFMCDQMETPHTAEMLKKYKVPAYSDALIIYKNDIKEIFVGKKYFKKIN